jgi:beta propeller repeat protein
MTDMKKKISILIAILAALCMSIFVQAETEVIRITDNGYEDILPAVHGNTIVWQGWYNGEKEIFLYDIAAAQTKQITDNDYPDLAPQTDGRYVVWLGMNNRGGNIFYYDTNSGQTIQVTTDNEIITIKSPPRIADGRIVWAAQVMADSVLPGEIELYDIETGFSTTISAPADPDNNLDDNTPVIDSTKVVWVQTGLGNIESTVFVHDLTSGDTFPAPDNFVTVQSPTQDGNLSISVKFDGQDKEIFLSHQRLRKNMQITDNGVDDKQSKIHGNHLVWVSGRGAEQEIYLGISRLLSAITPGDGFVLNKNSYYPVFEWEAIGFDRFRVQFSSTKDFTEGEMFTFPPLSDPWLYETSFTADESLTQWLDDMGMISSSLYWRIAAQDQYGNETTSQVRRIVMITDTDSDGIADSIDDDDDNDNQLDVDEITCGSDPLDPNSKSADNDGDFSPDCVDNDDDNDGVEDVDDTNPFNQYVCADSDLDTCDDCTSGSVNPGNDGVDTDVDGLCDAGDLDDDNDGVADGDDAFPHDPTEFSDNDVDGVGDNADTDDDNDTISDADESACGSDPLNAASVCDNDLDGFVDEGYDNDGDGFTICGGDCDDTDFTINSDAAEICDDGIDNNCDGLENYSPEITGFSTTIEPVSLGTSITAAADFIDDNSDDEHTVAFDWDDGSVDVYSLPIGDRYIEESHKYMAPGVYTIILSVSDGSCEEAVYEYNYIVIYDPEGGFVTGGGWINSPEGAYTADPTLTGKAKFGFNSKYKKGANIPTGQTQFKYKVGNLNFHSESYEWLVVAGARAQFKGDGTINGLGNYGFMLTGVDGSINGGGGVDKFRIKIWDKDASDQIVYDNMLDAPDDEEVTTTVIGGGQIAIHK